MDMDLLRTFLTAMTPLGELRLSIPLAILTWNVPWHLAFILSVIGNITPILFIVPGMNQISRLLQSFPNPLGRLLLWRTSRIQKTHGVRFRRYGILALIVLVAIPLPMTGAWTGALASWAFQIPPRTALPAIFIGILIAGGIVTGLTMIGEGAYLITTNK
jgi:uncharacterized membrane protein